MDANTQFFFELCIAAQNGEQSKVQEIIASVNNNLILNALTPELGLTILMLAAERGHLEIVRLLIEKNALLNVKANFGIGNTALMYAVAQGHLSVAEALLVAGADPCIHTLAGESALGFAEFNKDQSMMTLLNRYIPKKSESTLTISSLLNGLACFVPSFDFLKNSVDTSGINRSTVNENKKISNKILQTKLKLE